MEPPTPSLMTALGELKLASGRDLRRAARHGRRLSRDLPAFDSVWIDSLVRLRRLTLFQAAELKNGRADRLRIGDYVLCDRLGGGPDASTYRARRLRDGQQVVLKVIDVPRGHRADVEERLHALTTAPGKRLSGITVVPDDLLLDGEFIDGGRLILVSPFVPGSHARSWLIRQGRLAPADVLDIARRLLAGLEELHRLGIAHGDIHAGNLILSPRGTPVLVDSGVKPALSPILRIDETRSPNGYEGTAPERIGTGGPATPASDVYGLGCLLWHLLAGRPPFPAGDALTVLTAHRSRPLPPVADFVPSTPPELAELIAETTRLDPAERPADLIALQRRLRPPRMRLHNPHRPHTANETSRHGLRWLSAAAVLIAAGGIGVTLLDRDSAGTLLSITGSSGVAAVTTGEREMSEPTRHSLLPLPEPDDQGVITLDHPGPYTAGDLVAKGPLVLRGRRDRPATILVHDRPLHVLADECTLEHVQFLAKSADRIAGGSPALVLVESQNLTIRSCRFETDRDIESIRPAGPTGVAWRLIDRQDPTAGRLRMEHCVARSVREPLYLADPAREITISNVLAVGVRSLLSHNRFGALPATVTIEHVTLRDTSAVAHFGDDMLGSSLHITARDSILDLTEGGSLYTGDTGGPAERLPNVSWGGEGVVTTRAVVAMATDASNSPDAGTEGASIVGVSRATVEFAGPARGSDAASVATVYGVPRKAGHTPGIDLSRLPPAPP